MSVLDQALKYLANGLSIVPVKADGSKAPDLTEWKTYQGRKPTVEEVASWYAGGNRGIGIVCGAVNGNLGVLDFEFSDLYEQWIALMWEEHGELLAKLPVVVTPGKDASRGRHVYFRCESTVRGRKLAKLSKQEVERRGLESGKNTAIEVRGEGHQVLAPGCPVECHESGRTYDLERGPGIHEAPVLSNDDVKTLFRMCRVLDQAETRTPVDPQPEEMVAADGEVLTAGSRPGDIFSKESSWESILEPSGWEVVRRFGSTVYWKRPGKDKGTSATTGHCHSESTGDLLYVFSSNADPFESDRCYSKFAAYALLNHGGNYHQAAIDLTIQGYGKRLSADDDGEVLVVSHAEKIEPFPVEVLPESLAAYAKAIAESIHCPVDFAAVAMLAVAGSVIGSTRAVAIHRKWRESPRMYLAIIAEPSGGKSPSVDMIMEPVIDLQQALDLEHREKLEQYEADLEAYEDERASRRKSGKGDGDREPLEKPTPPIYPHLYTTDPTIEALSDILCTNQRGLIMVRDEVISWCTAMNQYKGGKGADRQFWLSVWSGQTAKTDRKGGGPRIAHKPFVSVLGGIQPDKLSCLISEDGANDGFLDRILFSWPENHKWSRTIGESPPEELESAWVDALEYIYGWTMAESEHGTLSPEVVGITPEGRKVVNEWWASHADTRNMNEFDPGLIGPYGKLKSYYFRFALVIQCLRLASGETDCQDVDAESATRAVKLIDYFKSHLDRVMNRLGCVADDVKAVQLVEFIRARGGSMTARRLVHLRKHKKTSDADKALRDLVDRGYGLISTPAGKKSGVFQLHNQAEYPDEPEEDQAS